MIDGSEDEGDGQRLEAVTLREETQHGETGQDPEDHQQEGVIDRPH